MIYAHWLPGLSLEMVLNTVVKKTLQFCSLCSKRHCVKESYWANVPDLKLSPLPVKSSFILLGFCFGKVCDLIRNPSWAQMHQYIMKLVRRGCWYKHNRFQIPRAARVWIVANLFSLCNCTCLDDSVPVDLCQKRKARAAVSIHSMEAVLRQGILWKC